jgi:hypothetical protein
VSFLFSVYRYRCSVSLTFIVCLEDATEIIMDITVFGGSGSSVGIVTGCGMDGPGIESRWGRDFLHLSRPALGPT